MTEEVSKGDGALRQLVTAINLYFDGEDNLAIHTLAGASLQVFDDLSKGTSYANFNLREKILLCIPEEFRKEFRRKIRFPQNFLKHADNDKNGKLVLSAEETELTILCACVLGLTMYDEWCSKIHYTQLLNLNIFAIWYFKKNEIGLNQEIWDEVMSVIHKLHPPLVPLSFYCSKGELREWVNRAIEILLVAVDWDDVVDKTISSLAEIDNGNFLKRIIDAYESESSK